MSGQEKNNKVISFKEIKGSFSDMIPLRNLAGMNITIIRYEIQDRNLGKMAIIVTESGTKYYTFSEVIISQLQQIEEYLKSGYKVKAKIVKQGRYLTLK